MNQRILNSLSMSSLALLLAGCASASFTIDAELPLGVPNSETSAHNVEVFTSYMDGIGYSCRFRETTPPTWACAGESTKRGFPEVELLIFDHGMTIHFRRVFTKWVFLDDTPPAPGYLQEEYSELIPLLSELGAETVLINAHDGRVQNFKFDEIDWSMFEN